MFSFGRNEVKCAVYVTVTVFDSMTSRQRCHICEKSLGEGYVQNENILESSIPMMRENKLKRLAPSVL